MPSEFFELYPFEDIAPNYPIWEHGMEILPFLKMLDLICITEKPIISRF